MTREVRNIKNQRDVIFDFSEFAIQAPILLFLCQSVGVYPN